MKYDAVKISRKIFEPIIAVIDNDGNIISMSPFDLPLYLLFIMRQDKGFRFFKNLIVNQSGKTDIQ